MSLGKKILSLVMVATLSMAALTGGGDKEEEKLQLKWRRQ